MGFENFTDEDVRQLHEDVSEPAQASPVDRRSDDSVSSPQVYLPLYKVQRQARDFDYKFAELICSQRKRYSTTDKTIFGLANEWMDFYRGSFDSGKTSLKSKLIIERIITNYNQ